MLPLPRQGLLQYDRMVLQRAFGKYVLMRNHCFTSSMLPSNFVGSRAAIYFRQLHAQRKFRELLPFYLSRGNCTTNERQSCVIIVDPLSQYLPIRNVHRFEMIVVYTASFVLISDDSIVNHYVRKIDQNGRILAKVTNHSHYLLKFKVSIHDIFSRCGPTSCRV